MPHCEFCFLALIVPVKALSVRDSMNQLHSRGTTLYRPKWKFLNSKHDLLIAGTYPTSYAVRCSYPAILSITSLLTPCPGMFLVTLQEQALHAQQGRLYCTSMPQLPVKQGSSP